MSVTKASISTVRMTAFPPRRTFLRMLRPDKSYTDLEARVLDLALILHMEHGGGNNSTFTTHVVTSSGSDTPAGRGRAGQPQRGPSTAARTSRWSK